MLKIILTRLWWAVVQIQRLFFSASHAWYMSEHTFKCNSSKTTFEDLCVWELMRFLPFLKRILWKTWKGHISKKRKILLTFIWRYLFWYENACKWNFQIADSLFLKKGSQTRWRTKKNSVLSSDLASWQGSVLIAICLQSSVSSFQEENKCIHLCVTWFTSQLSELPSKLAQPLKRISVSYSHSLSFTFCVMCIYAYECMQIYWNDCICSDFL